MTYKVTSYRITQKDLEQQVQELNTIFDLPQGRYTENEETGEYTPNPGVFHLSYAYGGVALHQMSNKPGCTGISSVFNTGHITKRELFNKMTAYIQGLRDSRYIEQKGD